METIIKNLVNEIKNNLVHDMNCEQTGDDTTMLVLAAYNRFQEDERDGADYIFDMTEWSDINCCAEGGLSVNEFNAMFNDYCNGKTTRFFRFGHSKNHVEAFETWEQLKTYLTNFLNSVITHMITFHDVDGYKQLFAHCISDYMILNNLV